MEQIKVINYINRRYKLMRDSSLNKTYLSKSRKIILNYIKIGNPILYCCFQIGDKEIHVRIDMNISISKFIIKIWLLNMLLILIDKVLCRNYIWKGHTLDRYNNWKNKW